jgi:hypothetical protein
MESIRRGKRMVMHCKICGEPTTHVFQSPEPGAEPRFMCMMHEGDRQRPGSELESIRAKRKGWVPKQ